VVEQLVVISAFTFCHTGILGFPVEESRILTCHTEMNERSRMSVLTWLRVE